jgi:hypothetical protein
MEWLAHLITYFHALLFGHSAGKMTVAACDVGKIESQVKDMQRGENEKLSK